MVSSPFGKCIRCAGVPRQLPLNAGRREGYKPTRPAPPPPTSNPPPDSPRLSAPLFEPLAARATARPAASNHDSAELVVIPLVVPVPRQASGKRLTLSGTRLGFASLHRVPRRRAFIRSRSRLSPSSRAGPSFISGPCTRRPATCRLRVPFLDG